MITIQVLKLIAQTLPDDETAFTHFSVVDDEYHGDRFTVAMNTLIANIIPVECVIIENLSSYKARDIATSLNTLLGK